MAGKRSPVKQTAGAKDTASSKGKEEKPPKPAKPSKAKADKPKAATSKKGSEEVAAVVTRDATGLSLVEDESVKEKPVVKAQFPSPCPPGSLSIQIPVPVKYQQVLGRSTLELRVAVDWGIDGSSDIADTEYDDGEYDPDYEEALHAGFINF